MTETLAGKVIHYYSKLGVVAVSLDRPLKRGDVVHILGHTTDVEQVVESMEINHQQVATATPGSDLAIKVVGKVRDGDKLYLKVA